MAGVLAIIGITIVPGIETAAAEPASTTPSVRWTRQFGSTDFDDVEGAGIDPLGRVSIAGATSGTLTSAGNLGFEDAFVRQYSRGGQVRWTRQFGSALDDHAKDMAVDAQGNILVVGVTFGKLPGPKKGGEDAWVRKYRSDGSLAWARQFGTAADDEGRGIAVDGAGNVYVAGETQGSLQGTPHGSTDAFLRKYSPTGVLRWTRQFGTTSTDQVDGAAADADGNAWVIGTTLGDLAVKSAGDYDAYVRGYDTNGHLRWTRQIGSPAGDYAVDAEPDVDGNLVVVGSTDGALPGGGSDQGQADAFVLKLSRVGGVLWTRQFGTDSSDYPELVDVDGNGNAYIGGSTGAALPGQSFEGAADAFVQSVGRAGGVRWTVEFGTSESEGVKGLAVRGVDEVIVAGYTQGSFAAPLKGPSDVYLRRYGPAS